MKWGKFAFSSFSFPSLRSIISSYHLQNPKEQVAIDWVLVPQACYEKSQIIPCSSTLPPPKKVLVPDASPKKTSRRQNMQIVRVLEIYNSVGNAMLEQLPPYMQTLRAKQHLLVDATGLTRSSPAITKCKGVHNTRILMK